MKNDSKIDRLERTISRLKEEKHALKDENLALQRALEDKDRQLVNLKDENSLLIDKMEQMTILDSEAIEAAYEAKMKYEKAEEECRKLMKKYSSEMKASLKQINLIRKG